ncbi:L-threonylcarbamoyladenylate synthase [Anaerotruncus sp. AF02-27]|uniref:L-threonylcarbamoyladenylate synthase n=1 Tax=Anaerotruncus sp. AF02-27 TaxID=2292191 RepID=UPI001FA83ED0|nr:L-threonylcarbamoyladenylate synthase [Anaerotruncus sp. AF02-27]
MPRTKVLKVTDIEKDRAALDQAAALLREGKLVAIPTETVYGLAANALDPQAAHAIYTAKGRPGDNPLIVHVSDLSQIPPLVKTVPDALRRLAEAFWPGPMTVIMEKSDKIPPATSGGLETVAIRMPSHPVARELIRRSGVPLAAPSANLSGSPSPTTAQHCIDDLTGRVDAIVDGGECEVGVESTVLTLCTDPPSVLRPGAVTLEMLRQVIPEMTLDPGVFEHLSDDCKVASPGMKYKHYSPKARVVLVRGDLAQFGRFVASQKQDFGILCFEEDAPHFWGRRCITYGHENDPASQAHRLFDALRQGGKEGLGMVYVRISDIEGIGQAVYNRLLRAAGFDVILL